MLRLSESQTRSLLAEPETGMGYQAVEVTHRDRKIEKGIVYNAELLFEGAETRNILHLTKSYSSVLKAASTGGNDIVSLRVLKTREGVKSLSARDNYGVFSKKAGPAKE